MEGWKKDSRREVVMVDIDELVPRDHLLRKVERVMDYDWIYEKLDSYYNHDVGRPGTDPVVLIKMVLIQHLFGIPSLRQTHREIQVNLAYRWFLGYSLLDSIPHFATVSYAFCNRFPAELGEEIFTHILSKALNNRMVDPSVIFIDGTQIKANANNKKRQKELIAQTAKIYDEKLREEVNADREAHGKKPFDDDDEPPTMVEKTVSTTDPDAGVFRKGEHKTEFAYEAHTACDCNGFVLDVEVTAGNVHDSVAFDAVYEKVTERFPEVETVAADSAYKTPWITKRIIDDGRIPSMPYTRASNIKPGMFRPWEYKYDIVTDSYICPRGESLRHTTTDRDGKKKYLSDRAICKNCPRRMECNNNANCQKTIDRHIWQEYIDIANDIRKTDWGQFTYALRSQTIERVFADAKEKHAMRYTHHRGLTRVANWVRLKYAAMNLKKLARWAWKRSSFAVVFAVIAPNTIKKASFAA